MRKDARKERRGLEFEREKTHLEDLVVQMATPQQGPHGGGQQFIPINTESPVIAVWYAALSVPFS